MEKHKLIKPRKGLERVGTGNFPLRGVLGEANQPLKRVHHRGDRRRQQPRRNQRLEATPGITCGGAAC